jgi:SWI/SNF-related matrix-associated actin-dependent regulator 1 of chromatin subfamily A
MAPKAAGFRWDPADKVWWTTDPSRAAQLAKYANDSAKAHLKGISQRLEATLAASRAVDADVAIPAPDGREYRPFQRAGIAFALSMYRSMNGDDMGLGKTIQGIGVVNACADIRRVLIICPASLRLNWAKELRNWLVRNLTVAVAESSKPFPHDADIVVINYDILGKFRDQLRRETWDLLICDEAHYLKNETAQRTRNVFGSKAKARRGEAAEAITPIPSKRSMLLTGTPITNRPKELWPLVEYSCRDRDGAPAEFRSKWAFLRRYCGAVQTRWGWDVGGATNLGELQEKLRATFMIRRLKAEVLTELPAKRRQVIEIPANGATQLVAAEMEAYDQAESALESLRVAVELAKASDDPADYEAAVRNLRDAEQVAFVEVSRRRHETALATVPYAITHLRDVLETGQKVVVFAHHMDVIDALMAEFGSAAVKLDGRDSMEARNAAVERFQTNPSVQVFLGGIMAAGVGLTLTAASHVVFVELDWVPANITQAEDRCHRMGQRNSVLVQHLVLEGSLAARMANTLVTKQDIIDRALDRTFDRSELEAPLVEASREAATRAVRREKLAEEAALITADQAAAVLQALQILAAKCDGARAIDGAGFSKLDAAIGKSLAANDRLTPKQAALGRRIANKYRRQYSEGLLAAMWGREVV